MAYLTCKKCNTKFTDKILPFVCHSCVDEERDEAEARHRKLTREVSILEGVRDDLRQEIKELELKLKSLKELDQVKVVQLERLVGEK